MRSVAPDSAGSAVSQNIWFLDSMKPARSRLTTTTLHSIQMLKASISAGMEIHRLRLAMRAPVCCRSRDSPAPSAAGHEWT